MKLTNVEKTYILTKKELEELLGIKIKRIYCDRQSGTDGYPTYDLTIYTEGDD